MVLFCTAHTHAQGTTDKEKVDQKGEKFENVGWRVWRRRARRAVRMEQQHIDGHSIQQLLTGQW